MAHESYDKAEVKKAATGRWEAILGDVCGWKRSVFNGKNQPCPLCGGTDRFRWGHKDSRKKDEGFGFCLSCFPDTRGSMDGFGWYTRARGESFGQAVNSLGRYLGGQPVERMAAMIKQSRAVNKSKSATREDVSADLTDELVRHRLKQGAPEHWHFMPLRKLDEDGECSEGFVNLAMVEKATGRARFMAKTGSENPQEYLTPGGFTRLLDSVADGAPIYVVVDPMDALEIFNHRKAEVTPVEVWLAYTAMNALEISARYQGDREMRLVACTADDNALFVDRDRPVWGGSVMGVGR